MKYFDVVSWTGLTDDGVLPIFLHSPNHRQEMKERTTEWITRTSFYMQAGIREGVHQ